MLLSSVLQHLLVQACTFSELRISVGAEEAICEVPDVLLAVGLAPSSKLPVPAALGTLL